MVFERGRARLMSQIRKQSRVLLLSLAVPLILGAILLLVRSRNPSSWTKETVDGTKPDLAYLSILKSNQLLAKVGSVQLRSHDLRDVLQLEFHDQTLHSSFSPQDLSLKMAAGLDRLIEEELLAQGARNEGLKTSLRGAEGRQDLASQYVKTELVKLPPVTDSEVRSFYRNHGEKFLIPGGVQVREFFVAHQGEPKKKGKQEKAYYLAEELAHRIKRGDSLEELTEQYVPQSYRERTKGYLFKGSTMEVSDDKRVLALRPAEVVGPLRVEGGYSVFQGIASERSRLIPFYQAKEKIRVYLERSREEALRKNLVNQLQRQISVERFRPDTVLAAVH
jgi:hypothetical protein